MPRRWTRNDDRVLGFEDPGILAAFESARKQRLYANAKASEYFAELTVTYFASRAATPHHRGELRVFDPQGFRAVERAWGVNQ